MKNTFTIVEKVVNEYEFDYDIEELEKRGITLEEYLKKYDNNIWRASNEDTIISNIYLEECIEYLDTDYSSLEIR